MQVTYGVIAHVGEVILDRSSCIINTMKITIGGTNVGWIYKITNQVNMKMYFGKTEDNDPTDRWKEHIRDSHKRRCEKRPLYDAFNKYGVENFKFEVVDQTDDPDDLCELEKFYINKYRTYVGFKDCNGYNATLGGDGKCYLNLNDQEVINYHIENGYIAGITAKHYCVDRKSITKILKRHNVMWLSSEQISMLRFKEKYGGLVQIDNDYTGTIISIYESPSKAVEESNGCFKYSTLNSAYVTSGSHKAYGYIWYRLSELPEEYRLLLDEYYQTHDK